LSEAYFNSKREAAQMNASIFFVKTLAILALVLINCSAIQAGEVLVRENNQQSRINQGIQSGELTPFEASQLEHAQNRIEKHRAKALSDGKLTWNERARLHHEQKVQSRKIFKFKHNRRDVN
jgi:hypothetical protein